MKAKILLLLSLLMLAGCGGQQTHEASLAAVKKAFPNALVFSSLESQWRFVVIDGHNAFVVRCLSTSHDGPTDTEIFVKQP